MEQILTRVAHRNINLRVGYPLIAHESMIDRNFLLAYRCANILLTRQSIFHISKMVFIIRLCCSGERIWLIFPSEPSIRNQAVYAVSGAKRDDS